MEGCFIRASVIIAAHNEGDRLWRTVGSVSETSAGLDCEIIVADDASWDGSVEEMSRRFPHARVVRHEERKGTSATKDLGARHARGEVLVFLDGHTKPEPGAIQRLVEDVEGLEGAAVVTPTVCGLCPERWKALPNQIGHGYFLELERLDCGWVPLRDLREHPHRGRMFYESPALIGCALAVNRELYDDLRGFDPHMLSWGVEDLDFGLKCWLLGRPILHDPEAVVAHRFRRKFDNFAVPIEHLVHNQLRMARKNFTEGVWREWLERCRRRYPGKLVEHPEGLWARVWELFGERRASVEQERAHLLARRVRDEFWYAERFGLQWPRLEREGFVRAESAEGGEPEASPSPAPSEPPPPPPPPEGCCPDPDEWAWTNIMDPDCWYRINATSVEDQPFNWNILQDGQIWEVVPTALTDGNAATTLDNPPAGGLPRETNSMATKCLFGDFNLQLEFRCPNRRGVWTEGADCGSAVKGVRNWGNSGVYIFNLYEVQILDSYVAVYTHLGLPTGTGSRSTRDQRINLVDDTRYVGQGWKQSTGPIVLQEHDNRVQFRNITINPAWVPTVGGQPDGAFDSGWQRAPDPTATIPWQRCKAP